MKIRSKEFILLVLLCGACLLTPIHSWMYWLLFFLYGYYLTLCYRHPDWVCGFIIFVLPLTRVPKFTPYVELGQYAVIAPVVMFWVFKKFSQRSLWLSLKQNPLNPFILTMGILILMTTLYSPMAFNIKPFAAHGMAFVFIYFLYDLLMVQKASSKKLVWFLCLAGLIEAVLAILQYFMFKWNLFSFLQPFILPGSSRDRLLSQGVQGLTEADYRSYGTFYTPNLLGIYLAMILPLCLSLFLSTHDKSKKTFLLVISFIIALGILLSDSRGGMVNAAGAGIFLLVFAWERIPKRLISIFAIGFVLLAVLCYDPLKSFLKIDRGLSYRDIIWEHALELFQEHPVTGWGLGTMARLSLVRYGFPSINDLDMALSEIISNKNFDFLQGFHAHNLFLNYAVETGLAGMILIIYFYFFCLKRFLSFISRRPFDEGGHALLAVGCASAVFGNFLHSFFEVTTNFYYLPTGLTFVFIVMILMKHTYEDGDVKTTA